ncbi:xyloglucan O-acetyltransferase 4-like [Tasmannia lanceolata]|uniref:xyloglucan O-acetyltransferase 4-like n=1 Tax=Tasmannia lanceolata TaxID=3420 RepID=UPI0040644B6A
MKSNSYLLFFLFQITMTKRIKSFLPPLPTFHKEKNIRRVGLLLLFSFTIAFIFLSPIFYSPNPIKITPKYDFNQSNHLTTHHKEEETCDLFTGRWVPDPKGSSYTNWSCLTLPDSNNCAKFGRKDKDFVNWRWKPDGCDLPRFEPKSFLSIVRGKKLAFIGDSVARNHMESLLCLLSQAEIPTDIYKDTLDRFRTWYFPSYDFTLMVLRSNFLVLGIQRVTNGISSGVFDLHADKIDVKWSEKLPEIDYAVISDAHWLFRTIYLHKGEKLIGCVFCNDPNITDLGLGFALRTIYRTALEHVNGCKGCGGLVTLVRTFSPAHFENGTWNDGGRCSRTSPLSSREVNFRGNEGEFSKIQVEEVERVKRKQGKKRFGVLDITKAMLMRADGHPGSHWNNEWMKGFNDCVHWCLPGPIDMWNDLLLGMLKRESSLQ